MSGKTEGRPSAFTDIGAPRPSAIVANQSELRPGLSREESLYTDVAEGQTDRVHLSDPFPPPIGKPLRSGAERRVRAEDATLPSL